MPHVGAVTCETDSKPKTAANQCCRTSMTLKLKPSPSPLPPFTWDVPSPASSPETTRSASPPTSWLSARDMKVFGARPLTSTSDIGIVKCKECAKPVLRSFMIEHAGMCAAYSKSLTCLATLKIENCEAIRSGVKKGVKGKVEVEGTVLSISSTIPDLCVDQRPRKVPRSARPPLLQKNQPRRRTSRLPRLPRGV